MKTREPQQHQNSYDNNQQYHTTNNNNPIIYFNKQSKQYDKQTTNNTREANIIMTTSTVSTNNNNNLNDNDHHDATTTLSYQQQLQQAPTSPQQQQQQVQQPPSSPLQQEPSPLQPAFIMEPHLHSPDATPPMVDVSLDPVRNVCQRLLGLRGSPPGTLATLAEHEIKMLCATARPIVLEQPMLLELEAPMKICGDVHGQYTDLLRLLEYGGFPPESNYLFLGDYVDRGKQSLEVMCLLLCYKILYPENFFILRGNHEAAGINRIYGFYDECKRRYSIKLWKVFSDVFNCLPAAALVDEKILCMHGGLSPELHHVSCIADLPRPCDVPDVGLLCDLLWSDPDATIKGWAENDRGVSFVFGADVVTHFLEAHDLDLLVRAHQVVEDGYEFFAGRRLVTVFSAPNYCGEFDNAGGMISVDENLLCSFQILKPSTRSTRFANTNSSSNSSNSQAKKNQQHLNKEPHPGTSRGAAAAAAAADLSYTETNTGIPSTTSTTTSSSSHSNSPTRKK